MSSARGTAEILGSAVAEAKAAAESTGEQASLELGDALEPGARAIAEAAGADDVDQVDQLGLPDAGEILEIQRELDCDVWAAVREHRRRSGKGGRKPGSRNKRTGEFRAFILSQGGHPGAFLQRVMDRPVELLAAELGCDKRDALDRQIRCASELMPYVEGKMPVRVDVAVRGDFSLIAGAGTGLFDGLDEIDDDALPLLDFSPTNQAVGESEGS